MSKGGEAAESRLSTIRGYVDAAAECYPSGSRLAGELLAKAPSLLGTQIGYLAEKHGEQFWAEADRLAVYAKGLEVDGVGALIEYTMENLRAQAEFMATKEYAHSEFQTAFDEVYNNPDVMEKYYLPGLLLTHAFWPIHFALHRFFEEEFVSRVPDAGQGAEFGFGHGLYLLDVLSARPGTTALGFDISPYAEKFAARLLELGGIDAARVSLGYADVREPFEIETGQLQWAVFAEVLEHIADPAAALHELRRCVAPNAPIYLTTVIDCNAIDHLYQFEDLDAVRAMLAATGFTVAAERVCRVSDLGETRDPTVDVAYVCLPTV